MKYHIVFLLFCSLQLIGASINFSHVIMPKNPTRWDEKALSELQLYSKKINGKDFPVLCFNDANIPKDGCIYIGDAAKAKKLAVFSILPRVDDYILELRKNNLGISGPAGAGVLFGVYGFLRMTGVKIYAENCEILPKKMTISSECFKRKIVPTFELRNIEAGFWRWNRYYRNFNATRLGFTAQFREEKLGAVFAPIWVDPKVPFSSAHTTRAMLPAHKYWKSNPEYFAHDAKGKLITKLSLGNNKYIHICTSNPIGRKICKQEFMRWIKLYPESIFFFIGQEDLTGHCECKNCRSLDPFPGKKERGFYVNLSDRMASFINHIAADVKNKYPSKLLLSLAYRETSKPVIHSKYESNVRIALCPSPITGARCKSHSYSSCCYNKKFKKYFYDWLKVAPGRIYIWNYCMNFTNRYTPFFCLDAMVKNLHFYNKNGVKGVCYNGAQRLFIQLFCYIQGRLTWDIKLDSKKLEKEFMNVFYGPAAPEMTELLELVRSRINSKFDPVHQPEYSMLDSIVEPIYLKDAAKIFARAETKVKNNPKYLKRVRYEKLSALLLPTLDADFESDPIKKLEMLREMAIIVNNWGLVKLKGSRFFFNKWIENKIGFSIKMTNFKWTKSPKIIKLLKCKTKQQIKAFAIEEKIKL
jgi:uncharacterized protein DUF4838